MTARVADASGGGGFGKSTLARLVAHDRDVREHFSDGIVWVAMGPRQRGSPPHSPRGRYGQDDYDPGPDDKPVILHGACRLLFAEPGHHGGLTTPANLRTHPLSSGP
jgi:hypothetical protein